MFRTSDEKFVSQLKRTEYSHGILGAICIIGGLVFAFWINTRIVGIQEFADTLIVGLQDESELRKNECLYNGANDYIRTTRKILVSASRAIIILILGVGGLSLYSSYRIYRFRKIINKFAEQKNGRDA